MKSGEELSILILICRRIWGEWRVVSGYVWRVERWMEGRRSG
jgi:hypothetical protein